MRNSEEIPIIFTPDNEPYLGRELLFHLDKIISSALQQSAAKAPATYGRELTEHQRMACQVIAQSLSIALSIRELIRQGYLFGGHVLLRALVERQTILLYLHLHPDEIKRWERGWHNGDAPGLAKMLEEIQRTLDGNLTMRGKDLTKAMNGLLHAKPESAWWSLVLFDVNAVGHTASKTLNRPELCDALCADVIPALFIVQSMINAYFPSEA